MRILVVGSGGREHALCWKLAQEAHVYCVPGNPGIESVATCFAGNPADPEDVIAAAQTATADLVVIGPEDPLIAGLADGLRAVGFTVLGPGKIGAQLEGSKAFAKKLMTKYGVPSPPFETFQDPTLAKKYVLHRGLVGRQVVVKASGNALGKGVVVCDDGYQADAAIDQMLIERRLGEAGSTIVVEDRLTGPEFSLITICSKQNYVSLPVAQDYKRAHDGDQGPNTGGMGSVSPVPWVNAELVARTERAVVAPILRALAEDDVDFRGVLFSGLILHDGDPYCLEYNVRFGDPETQSIVRRLGDGFADLLLAAARGDELPQPQIKENAAVSVVVASENYPISTEKGKRIEIGPSPDEVLFFHAGTGKDADNNLVTAGGRVIAVSAEAPTIDDARRLAYEGAEAVRFDGAWYRNDIAKSM
ncbi:MAG: Phosphoribosylamine--glycine ligase [Fimbriimonadaceae bacterium]|nr:Phosphoribosylamine--glycine ligase [Fimbriimonadaceae bacterium]